MLTKREKYFIQAWKEQREGPRWKYYLQYTIAWGTVIFLSLFFLTKLIMSDRKMGYTSFYVTSVVAVILALLVTHTTYALNEKKLNKILEREEQMKNNSLQ